MEGRARAWPHASAARSVGEEGLEPSRSFEHELLKLACLPFHHSPAISVRAGQLFRRSTAHAEPGRRFATSLTSAAARAAAVAPLKRPGGTFTIPIETVANGKRRILPLRSRASIQ